MTQFRFLLTTLLLVIFAGIENTFSTPTFSHPIQITQSDGTKLTIRIIGDERFHNMLSQEGYPQTGGAERDLYSAALSPSGMLMPTQEKARPINQLTAQAITVSCSEAKTEDPVLKAQRTALLQADIAGIYRAAKPVLHFDKTTQPLFTKPSKNTFRIQDDTGTKYVTLPLNAIPTDQGQIVVGKFSDNLGLHIGEIDNFYIKFVRFKSDNSYLRSWSDNARIGFIFPRIGIKTNK